MNTGILLLTSTGLSSPEISCKFLEIAGDVQEKKVAIITTAAEGKESNKYSQLAYKQFLNIGFPVVDFVDLEAEPSKDFSLYDVVDVCGGNTFKLLKFAQIADFKNSLDDLLKRGGIYIGVSAGSIIVGPSIEIANEVQPDSNDVGIVDFTGLCITDSIVLPHYSLEIEEEVKEFEKKYHTVVKRIHNSQAILTQGEHTMIVE